MHKHFELHRKLFHILVGIVMLLLYFYALLTPILLGITLIVGCILSYLSRYYNLPIIHLLLEKFERKNMLPGKGALTFLLGCFLAIIFFEKEIALAAISILTFGDAFAHLIGKYYGITKHPLNAAKLLEGTIAGIIIGSLAALFFVSPTEAFVAALCAIGFESLEIRIRKYVIDDNISIPLIAGSVIFLVRLLI